VARGGGGADEGGVAGGVVLGHVAVAGGVLHREIGGVPPVGLVARRIDDLGAVAALVVLEGEGLAGGVLFAEDVAVVVVDARAVKLDAVGRFLHQGIAVFGVDVAARLGVAGGVD